MLPPLNIAKTRELCRIVPTPVSHKIKRGLKEAILAETAGGSENRASAEINDENTTNIFLGVMVLILVVGAA